MLSAVANAPSLLPVVVYVMDDPSDFAGDGFTRFLDKAGVSWLPHRLSFADELGDEGRPFRALAWIDAAGLVLKLGPGLKKRGASPARALVTRAEVLFAQDVDLAAIDLCMEARAECATRRLF